MGYIDVSGRISIRELGSVRWDVAFREAESIKSEAKGKLMYFPIASSC